MDYGTVRKKQVGAVRIEKGLRHCEKKVSMSRRNREGITAPREEIDFEQ